MQFVVFHGAWDKSHVEGPYDPNATIGIDTFLRALDVHGVPPNSNVWVDVGTVWREVLRDPTTAAHTLGKLLKRVGEHRVLWGTDAIWYGSPQAQIQAFRAFTISQRVPGPVRLSRRSPTRSRRRCSGSTPRELFHLDVHATGARSRRDPLTGAQTTAAHLRDEGVLPAPARARTARRPGARCCSGSRSPPPAGPPCSGSPGDSIEDSRPCVNATGRRGLWEW